MSRKTVAWCDRCGSDIPFSGPALAITCSDKANVTDRYKTAETYDLCVTCRNRFVDFVQGKDTKAIEVTETLEVSTKKRT